MTDENRNFILAAVLCVAVLVGWQYFFATPPEPVASTGTEQTVQADATGTPAPADGSGLAPVPDTTGKPQVDEQLGGAGLPAAASAVLPRAIALEQSPRVTLDTPSVDGSISLTGARIDDLQLKNYRQTVDPTSPEIILLSPRGSENPYYAEFGWTAPASANVSLPSANTVWTQDTPGMLTPATPITLSYDNGAGLTFRKTISLDEDYMFTIEQTVSNTSGNTAAIAPYGLTVQRGMHPDLRKMMILHEGPVGVIGTTLYERKYQNVYKKKEFEGEGTGGWVGLTSKNWLSAVIPAQNMTYEAELGFERNTTKDKPVFNSLYRATPSTLPVDQSYTTTSHIYAGAKQVELLKAYQKPVDQGGLGIHDFDKAVDWGNFFFLTRPIFYLMHFFAGLTGNYGVAILLLTIVVKAFLFPLANKSYASMANMRKVTPEMTRIRERYETDKMKQQQEMMALYKKHNINPLAGCLPILIQMPVFYALYKTLFVTIETRHEPFLYIQDLSAADPAMIFNLFGLLPWDPSAVPLLGIVLGIGLLPLLMGAAMWVQMRLNPPPADPVQAQVFAFMPLIFIFIFAPFAAGLVLYWFWNTFLGVLQQYFIMKKHGTDVDLLGNIKQSMSFKKAPETANENKTNMMGGKSEAATESAEEKKDD